jgi:hypothetical protein
MLQLGDKDARESKKTFSRAQGLALLDCRSKPLFQTMSDP